VVVDYPAITELKWGGSAGGPGAGTALLVSDAAGRVMVIDSGPAESLWHAPLTGAAAAPPGQYPAVARAGADPLTGLVEMPFAQYLTGDYEAMTRDLHWL